MLPIKQILHKLLHHPNTMPWVFVGIMVAVMSSYNTIIRYGFSEKMLLRVAIVYPFVVMFIYYLRTYVSLPIAMMLHRYFPTILTKNVPKHVSVTVLVITFNVSVMMVWFTEIHRQLYPHFILGYVGNWAKTFFVAIPLYFFIVRPITLKLFNKLKQAHPISHIAPLENH